MSSSNKRRSATTNTYSSLDPSWVVNIKTTFQRIRNYHQIRGSVDHHPIIVSLFNPDFISISIITFIHIHARWATLFKILINNTPKRFIAIELIRKWSARWLACDVIDRLSFGCQAKLSIPWKTIKTITASSPKHFAINHWQESSKQDWLSIASGLTRST